jgi:glycosyltransferase 2 family protein
MMQVPKENPLKNHTLWYAVGFFVALAIFGVTAYIASSDKAAGWEYPWFMAINGWPEFLYWPMVIITSIASTWGVAVGAVTLFLVKAYRLAWRFALLVFGSYGVAFFAKELIGRPRPEGLFQDIHVRVAEHGMGFPSGHSTAITVMTLVLLPYLPWKWRWIIPVLIVAVMLSRIYLGVHVPLDVIGGLALGTAAVCFLRILPPRVLGWLHIH